MATSVVAMTTGSTQMRTGTACKDEEIDGYASNIVKKSVLILLVEYLFFFVVFAASLRARCTNEGQIASQLNSGYFLPTVKSDLHFTNTAQL